MKHKIICLFASLTFISFQSTAIDLHECRIGGDNSPVKILAECGHLSVAENRNSPDRMISLNIAIIRSQSSNKKKDPVIMLAGGPGQAAIEAYPGAASAFENILKHRDVVLVDQRGTGGSNKISCDFDQETRKRIEQHPHLIPEEFKKCVAKLDADTRYYTTQESIKDLEEVRKALNIDQWNLIGISYGTRKASTYIKMFPQSIRSIILDSVVPHQEHLAQKHEKNLVNALRKQFEQCEKQPACHEAFGDIEQQMWQMIDRVDKEKPVINLQNFSTGKYEEITMTKEHITLAIRMLSYSPRTMRILPLLIAKANHGQLEAIASQAQMVESMMGDAISNVELSILCAEDLPFYDDEYIVSDNNLFGKDLLDVLKKNCEVWPHIVVDSSFKKPVTSDLPVLLLSGELDPVTPPEFAEAAMQTLSNSQHLIAKGQGHNIFHLGCMPDIIAEFIDDPEQELNTECMQDFNYTPFFINMMGPGQ